MKNDSPLSLIRIHDPDDFLLRSEIIYFSLIHSGTRKLEFFWVPENFREPKFFRVLEIFRVPEFFGNPINPLTVVYPLSIQSFFTHTITV